MSKKARERSLSDTEAKAVARMLRVSPQKLNAENNHDLDVDDLVVVQAHVGKALVLKRHMPRARGRAGRIFKPFSNLTIVVREVEAQA